MRRLEGVRYLIKPCVGSGFCCKKARCWIGAQVHGPGRDCPSLVLKEGRYWCGEVLKATGDEQEAMKQDLSIGEGCCMSLFNHLRDAILLNMTEEEFEEYQVTTHSLSSLYEASSGK